MWAQMIRTSTIALSLGALATGLASAQARSAPAAGVHTLAVTVLSIVRVLVDPSVISQDGTPVVRVITNDPSLRAQFAAGVAPETLRRAGTVETGEGRAKGSEALVGGNAGDQTKLVRYTIVQP